MKRSTATVAAVACLLGLLLSGCTRRPLDIQLTREVDFVGLESLPHFGGSVVMLVDRAFWTSQEHTDRFPLARREKTFTIGPGAAQMAEQMLNRMFDEVVRARQLDRVEDLERFDLVIHLLHDSFRDRNMFFLVSSRISYRVGLGARVTRPDGTREGAAHGIGSEALWTLGLGEASPVEGKNRLAGRAGRALNLAVQEALFEMVDRLGQVEAVRSLAASGDPAPAPRP